MAWTEEFEFIPTEFQRPLLIDTLRGCQEFHNMALNIKLRDLARDKNDVVRATTLISQLRRTNDNFRSVITPALSKTAYDLDNDFFRFHIRGLRNALEPLPVGVDAFGSFQMSEKGLNFKDKGIFIAGDRWNPLNLSSNVTQPKGFYTRASNILRTKDDRWFIAFNFILETDRKQRKNTKRKSEPEPEMTIRGSNIVRLNKVNIAPPRERPFIKSTIN